VKLSEDTKGKQQIAFFRAGFAMKKEGRLPLIARENAPRAPSCGKITIKRGAG
jgi:hypothetical protein